MSAVPTPDESADRGRDVVSSKDAQVVDLRSKNKSFVSIAKTLGFDNGREALAAFNRGIRARPAAELAKLRNAEIKRLDMLDRRVRARSELGSDDIARRVKRLDRMRTDLLAD